jgi:hypothetical protein
LGIVELCLPSPFITIGQDHVEFYAISSTGIINACEAIMKKGFGYLIAKFLKTPTLVAVIWLQF